MVAVAKLSGCRSGTETEETESEEKKKEPKKKSGYRIIITYSLRFLHFLLAAILTRRHEKTIAVVRQK